MKTQNFNKLNHMNYPIIHNLWEYRTEPFLDFKDPNNINKLKEAFELVESNLNKEYPIFIDKEYYVDKKIVSVNPGNTEQVIGVFQDSSIELADKAVQVANESFKVWSKLNVYDRVNVFLRAANILRKRRFEYIAWMVLEVGKNWAEADADVAEAIDYLEYYSKLMISIHENPKELLPFPGEVNYYYYLPLGVVVVIPPWNFPLAIPLGMTVAALITGNTVILKPAEDSPMMSYLLYELLIEAGVPQGVINYLPGTGEIVGDYLVKHPDIHMIAFTGSKEVGLLIHKNAANYPGRSHLKRVIAEMGGKNAIIVDDIDDESFMDYAVNSVLVSAYGFQGQKCSALSRLILHKNIYDKFMDKLLSAVSKIEVGLPKENKFLGPVINEQAFNKIMHYIEIGKKHNKLLIGGKRYEYKYPGYYIEPTVFEDVKVNDIIAQEEIFGPVLAVMKYSDFDEAIKIANSVEYGLTGAVFSQNRFNINKAKQEFYCGNLYINRKCTGAIVGVHPFGGFKFSGTNSKAGGPDYLLFFLNPKSVSEKIDF
jgi:1-pyrroline-5-carboxylate dehydrogenase